MKRRAQAVVPCFLAYLLATSAFSASAGRPREDPREVEGRELFAKGDYQGALDIYAKLFAKKGDPIYLRNIGRCYQKMEQPDQAINAFEEYLRRAHVKQGERDEIDRFIKDMQDLQKERAATVPPPQPQGPPSKSVETAPVPLQPPVPVAEPAESASHSAPGATLSQEATPTDEQPASGSIFGRWWFWTGVGVLVAGGVTTAILLSRPHPGVMPPCPSSVNGMSVECIP